MARLRNEKIQPIWFHYIGKKGRSKVLIPSKGIVDVADFIEPISRAEVQGRVTVISDLAVKMMDAEKDVMSYINVDSSEK
jgi:hypothetical protein